MEKIIKALDIQRSAFARIHNKTLETLEKPEKDRFGMQGNIQILQQKIECLVDLNQKLMDLILDDDSIDEDPEEEMQKADSILEQHQSLKCKVGHLIQKRTVSTMNVTSVL
ncbi:hypothetical protein JTB14_037902 [Gonioctena quinquepunctata]|nr:hypothetical protein JTB14_037902 [Gonioctena quinquepunctata]